MSNNTQNPDNIDKTLKPDVAADKTLKPDVAVADKTLKPDIIDKTLKPDAAADKTLKPQAVADKTLSSQVADKTLRPAGSDASIKREIKELEESSKDVESEYLLNGVTYKTVKVLSTSSGEARILLVENKGQQYVLKLYYYGQHPDHEILEMIHKVAGSGLLVDIIAHGYWTNPKRTDEQLDFAIVYAAAKNGYAKLDLNDESDNMEPLFKTILERVPAPSGSDENPLQLQVFTLGYDNFVGKIGIARIFNGVVKKNQSVMLAKADGTKVNGRISKLIGFMGLEKMDIEEAGSGDIVAIAGFEALDVGDSVVDPNNPMPLDPLHIEEPTLSIVFSVNDGPLAGTEGKHVTSNKIAERLEAEMKTNIAMKYESTGEGKFKVSGRGELQITILAENMRREGFEFCMGRPEVIVKVEDGVKTEPLTSFNSQVFLGLFLVKITLATVLLFSLIT